MLSAVTLWLALSASAPDSGVLVVDALQHPPVAMQATTNGPGRKSDSPNSPVPEPTTLLLVGTGLVGLAVSSRRWRRALSSGNSS